MWNPFKPFKTHYIDFQILNIKKINFIKTNLYQSRSSAQLLQVSL